MQQIEKTQNTNKSDHTLPKVRLGSDPKSMARKPTQAAELLGQVFTPPDIAEVMIRELLSGVTVSKFRLLDPCVGPATFPSALLKHRGIGKKAQVVAFDVDPKMVEASLSTLSKSKISIEISRADYLKTNLTESFDCCIMNPPYIRQEWIENKVELKNLFKRKFSADIPGTSNLYVYFVVKAIHDLKPGGRFAFILYDSWQSTRYGEWLSRYLQKNCEEINCQAVRSQPFLNRLIDATIIYGRKRINSACEQDGELIDPFDKGLSPFGAEVSFVALEEVFQTKRGLRLKQKDFFLCDFNEFKSDGASQFVKKINRISGYAVSKQHPEGALLVTPSSVSKKVVAQIMLRLKAGIRNPEKNASILTWYRERPDTWYVHRTPPRARIIFNYYLRNRPKHIFNPCIPYSDNFYGITPVGVPALACLAVLNSTAVSVGILANARNQGSGLAKIQLYEYRKVPIPDLRKMSTDVLAKLDGLGGRLVKEPNNAAALIKEIDSVLQMYTKSELLKKDVLDSLFEKFDKLARKPRDN